MVKLNLGCGYKKLDGYVNIDKRSECEPDHVLDIAVSGLPYDDNTVGEIRSMDFLEHIPLGRTVFVIEEIWRVLKDGGIFEHQTPSTDGRGAFQDPNHLSFWNINSWLYYDIEMPTLREQTGIKAIFKMDRLFDLITNNQDHVIHTYGRMFAVKSEK